MGTDPDFEPTRPSPPRHLPFEFKNERKHGLKALSRLDWMVAQDMAKSGRFTVVQIEQGLREGSPNVEGRKAGHVDDYAQRTAAKAWTSTEVQAYREEQAKKLLMQHRYRGPSL